jgi:hypothetical protein
VYRRWLVWLGDPKGKKVFHYKPKECWLNHVYWNPWGDYCYRPVDTKSIAMDTEWLALWTDYDLLRHAVAMDLHGLPLKYTRIRTPKGGQVLKPRVKVVGDTFYNSEDEEMGELHAVFPEPNIMKPNRGKREHRVKKSKASKYCQDKSTEELDGDPEDNFGAVDRVSEAPNTRR